MVKIIAHRGASAHAPENTMEAFELALAEHADGIELDAMLSKDGQVVVIHDDSVDRTTNGSGRVKDLTLAELQELDAGDGEKIPSLAQVLECFGGKCLINIELKNYSAIFDSLPVKVAQLVTSLGLEKAVLISSFNPLNFPRYRRRVSHAEMGMLALPGKAKHWIWQMFRYQALHPHFSDVDQELVSKVHARNQQVNVWTVDDPGEIQRLAALNVDSIITNDPQKTWDVLQGAA